MRWNDSDQLLEIHAPALYIEGFSVDPVALLKPSLDVNRNAAGIAHTQTESTPTSCRCELRILARKSPPREF